tara:strand:+ start:381 stop:692 length:312 start_codon:yes stop_codon:yes gene_type:complete
MELDTLNLNPDNTPVKIKIPYITDFSEIDSDGMKVWQAVILTLSLGVFVGFVIALIQIISQKSEIISLKSNLRKIQNELDNLRNQNLEEDIPLFDEISDQEEI